MNIIKNSVKHLKENRMTYVEHLVFAFGHGCGCIKAGFLLLIHSIIPALYPRTGSKLITKLGRSFTMHKKNIANK